MRPGRSELVKQSDLDVRLIDEDGNLVPLLGFTLDEVVQLRERVRREQAANDRHISVNGSIDLLATADLEKAYCTLDLTYNVRLSQRDESEEVRWIPVPLRLDKAIVDLASIEYKNPAAFSLDKSQDGFVGWIRAKPNTEHTIKLQAKIVITETGGDADTGRQVAESDHQEPRGGPPAWTDDQAARRTQLHHDRRDGPADSHQHR